MSLDDPQSSNRYTYVKNDPINLVDPMGLKEPLVCPPDTDGVIHIWINEPGGSLQTDNASLFNFWLTSIFGFGLDGDFGLDVGLGGDRNQDQIRKVRERAKQLLNENCKKFLTKLIFDNFINATYAF
jgi:hypothetical protein